MRAVILFAFLTGCAGLAPRYHWADDGTGAMVREAFDRPACSDVTLAHRNGQPAGPGQLDQDRTVALTRAEYIPELLALGAVPARQLDAHGDLSCVADFDLLQREPRQRGVRDVEVIGMFVRHGPSDAELVCEIMPQPSVPLTLMKLPRVISRLFTTMSGTEPM